MAGAAALVLLIWAVWLRPAQAKLYDGPVYEVKKDRLQLTIVERGSLESAENSDIYCRVKAKSQGSTVASSIKWVIDDGTEVHRGQKVIELDDSGLQEQLKTQSITVNSARSNWIQADKNCQIQDSQNFSDLKTAEVNKILAELDLRKYVGDVAGTKLLALETRPELMKYLATQLETDLKAEVRSEAADKLNSEVVQTLNDIQGRIEIAVSDKEQAVDRSSWSKRMVKRGMISQSQADADKAKLESMDFNLKKVRGERDIFLKFTLERQVTDLWSKLKEAERALKRVQTQADARQVQANADRDSKKAIFDQESAKRDEIEEEIHKCYITAPQEGLVVYYIPEQSKYGGGSQNATIAQGEPVREGQKLMRIPNLSKMQVIVRVHEAMISKVRGEIRKPTGYGERMRAAFLTGLHEPLGQALYNVAYLEVRERDEFKDREDEVVEEGQKARIRIDAQPGKFYEGRVKTVATVASQAEFFSSDVKVYQTVASVEGTVQGLKPGMSAEVTILASEAAEPVLVVPIQSVVGNVAMGAKRKCWVLDENNAAHERDIEVGQSNDKLVEVRSGVKEGEKVVLSPKALLGEKSGLRAGTPATRRGADFEDGAEGGKRKKGFKGGGMPGGGMPGGGPGMQGGMPGGPGAAPGGPGGRGFNKQ